MSYKLPPSPNPNWKTKTPNNVKKRAFYLSITVVSVKFHNRKNTIKYILNNILSLKILTPNENLQQEIHFNFLYFKKKLRLQTIYTSTGTCINSLKLAQKQVKADIKDFKVTNNSI